MSKICQKNKNKNKTPTVYLLNVGLKLAMRDIILGDKIAMVSPLFSTSAGNLL